MRPGFLFYVFIRNLYLSLLYHSFSPQASASRFSNNVCWGDETASGLRQFFDATFAYQLNAHLDPLITPNLDRTRGRNIPTLHQNPSSAPRSRLTYTITLGQLLAIRTLMNLKNQNVFLVANNKSTSCISQDLRSRGQ